MIIMPSDNSGAVVHYWAGRYGHVGHLLSIGTERRGKGPWPWLPYALDNGAFPAWTRGEPWDRAAYMRLLRWAAAQPQRPQWALVPDVVTDRDATIASWLRWAPKLRRVGWPLAFAVQDGMGPADVPRDADVVFVGGSTEWKWSTLSTWCSAFPRVHVGRVNTYRWLRVAEDAGAESVDGTGWMRGNNDQIKGLEQWLKEASGEIQRTTQTSLSFADSNAPTGRGSKCAETDGLAPCGAARCASTSEDAA